VALDITLGPYITTQRLFSIQQSASPLGSRDSAGLYPGPWDNLLSLRSIVQHPESLQYNYNVYKKKVK